MFVTHTWKVRISHSNACKTVHFELLHELLRARRFTLSICCIRGISFLRRLGLISPEGGAGVLIYIVPFVGHGD